MNKHKRKTKKEFIEEHFYIEGMIEIGFFKKGWNYDQMACKVCHFFGLKNLYMYELILKKKNPPLRANLDTFSQN